MTPQISVLLPYRDAAATLEEAVDSVLSQVGVSVEVILVDDGSRDHGPELIEKLGARHRAVRHLRTPPCGIVPALQTALEVARAPLLARMDADDVSLPERFAQQREHLLAQPTLALSATQVVGFPAADVGEGLRLYIEWQNNLLSPEQHAHALFVEAPVCHPSVMIRAEVLRALGGWRDVPWAEDYDLWLRADAAGYRMAKVGQVLLRWRHHPRRLTFTDVRYSQENMLRAKAPHLARRVLESGRRLVIWGAGVAGKRLSRELEKYGAHPESFIDIDPKKIGRRARGVDIAAPDSLAVCEVFVVISVAARGARDEIRQFLAERGAVEGTDYLCGC